MTSCKDLKSLRDNFSNELPDTIVHAGRYKVRAGWFNAVIGSVGHILLNSPELFTPEEADSLQQTIESIINQWNSKECKELDDHQHALFPLTTREDIDRGSELLDFLISKLEC